MVADQDLNLSGLNCPQHIMRCKAALVRSPLGGLLHVMMTDPRCHHDILLLASALGDEIEHMETRNGVTEYWIRRHVTAPGGRGAPARPDPAAAAWFFSLASRLRDQLLPGRTAPALSRHM